MNGNHRIEGTQSDTTVLIVDPDAGGLRLLKLMFEGLGVAVSTAASHEDAVSAFKSRTFDMVVLAVCPQGDEEIETVRVLRGIGRPGRAVPIAAIRNQGFGLSGREMQAAGFDDCLVRPFTSAAIRRLLARWTEAVGGASGTPTDLRADDSLAPIDLELGARLVNNHRELAGSMLERLVLELPGHIGRLQEAHGSADREALRFLTHKLHGATCYTGVPRLRAACRELEKLLTGDPAGDEVEPRLNALVAAAKEVLAAFRDGDPVSSN